MELCKLVVQLQNVYPWYCAVTNVLRMWARHQGRREEVNAEDRGCAV